MRVLARLGLAALGAAVALLGLELGLRVLYPQVRIIEPHPRLGTIGRANLDVRKAFGGHERVVRVATNADGLRGPGLPSGKPPGTRRVLALGDSFTFGDAVEHDETWPAQLEALLTHGRAGGRHEVINAGVSGYGTGHAALLYRALEARVQPDVAVLGLTVVNDILDNLCVEEASYRPRPSAPCFTLQDGQLRLTTPSPPPPEPAHAWRGRRLRAVDFAVAQARRLTVWNPAVLDLARRLGLEPELPYTPATLASWYDPRYSEPGWRLTRHLLLDLRDHLARRGGALVVIVIPAAVQVDAGLQGALRRLGHRQPLVRAFLDDPTKPQRLVLELCREAELECVDLLETLLEAERAGARTYYAVDLHWTPRAHALAAAAIARRLWDLGLAVSPPPAAAARR